MSTPFDTKDWYFDITMGFSKRVPKISCHNCKGSGNDPMWLSNPDDPCPTCNGWGTMAMDIEPQPEFPEELFDRIKKVYEDYIKEKGLTNED